MLIEVYEIQIGTKYDVYLKTYIYNYLSTFSTILGKIGRIIL